MKPRMNANGPELVLKQEVYAVVGCAIEALKVRRHGLHERIYENCLCVEFRLRGIEYTQQERHRVMYKGEVVGEYVPDLVVQKELIVDIKTIERISDHERGQMLNYLRITGLQLGLILNFKYARLEWERIVLTREPQLNANERESEAAAVDFSHIPTAHDPALPSSSFASIRVHSRSYFFAMQLKEYQTETLKAVRAYLEKLAELRTEAAGLKGKLKVD